MKRSLPANFNPVYPYEEAKKINLIPPFFNTDGLKEDPFSVLSLNPEKPLQTANGKLNLQIGRGLVINSSGALEANGAAPTVSAPLIDTGTAITLKYSAPLSVNASNSLTVNAGNGLGLDTDTLTVNCDEPLTVETGTLQLKTGNGLTTNSSGELEAVAATFNAPLEAAGGAVSLNTAGGLTVTNNALAVSYSDPLTVNNSQLALKTGQGLRVNSSGQLEATASAVSYLSPLQITSSSTVKIGLDDPFDVSDNKLQLKLGQGLQLNSSGEVQASHTPPSYQAPLAVENGIVQLKYNAPLTLVGGILSMAYDSSMEVNTHGAMALVCADPLTVTSNGVGLNLGSGLKVANHAVSVNVGSGLSVDSNGALFVTSQAADETATLWTTPDPSPNVTLGADLSVRLTLALTRIGGLVLGSVRVEGVKTPDDVIAQGVTEKTITLYFSNDGQIINTYSSLKSQYWGFKQGQSIATSSYADPATLMPNLLAYPRDGQTFKNIIIETAYLQGDPQYPVPLQIKLNTEFITTGYTLRFTWKNLSSYVGRPFCTGTTQFSYIAQ